MAATGVPTLPILVGTHRMLAAEIVPLKYTTWRTLTSTAMLAMLLRQNMDPGDELAAAQDLLGQGADLWTQQQAMEALKMLGEQMDAGLMKQPVSPRFHLDLTAEAEAESSLRASASAGGADQCDSTSAVPGLNSDLGTASCENERRSPPGLSPYFTAPVTQLQL
eukprot:TRINITY_DN123700_c0_g1_i1.p1 TRINITY_DN123700_c0_g1~~TRINITY_DN123700_c0_g1_i1.p1  ORF type:complete len:181 (+),score=24.35 TRINITY_DN123700_c0_g1_i1:51-545(+)